MPTVNVVGDKISELNEQFTVSLSSPSTGVKISTASTTGFIQNDDAPPVFSIEAMAADKLEGSAGASTPFVFAVTRVGNTAGEDSLSWNFSTFDTPDERTRSSERASHARRIPVLGRRRFGLIFPGCRRG